MLKLDILNVTGCQQLRAGLLHTIMCKDTTHGFIQIDASNAFDSINQTLLLHNGKFYFLKLQYTSIIATWNLTDCSLQIGKRSHQMKEPPKET